MSASSAAIGPSRICSPTASSHRPRSGGSSISGRARSAARSQRSANSRYAAASAVDQSRSIAAQVLSRLDHVTTLRPSGNGANRYGSCTATSSPCAARSSSRTISGRKSDSVYAAGDARTPGYSSSVTQAPPTMSRRSKHSTVSPARARYAAATRPLWPAPITATSSTQPRLMPQPQIQPDAVPENQEDGRDPDGESDHNGTAVQDVADQQHDADDRQREEGQPDDREHVADRDDLRLVALLEIESVNRRRRDEERGRRGRAEQAREIEILL